MTTRYFGLAIAGLMLAGLTPSPVQAGDRSISFHYSRSAPSYGGSSCRSYDDGYYPSYQTSYTRAYYRRGHDYPRRHFSVSYSSHRGDYKRHYSRRSYSRHHGETRRRGHRGFRVHYSH